MAGQMRERNQITVAVVGVVASALIVLGSLSVGRISEAFSGRTITAELAESGGIRSGDEVRVSGVEVGRVRSVELGDGVVHVRFTVDGAVDVGDRSEVAVKSDNALGSKFLGLTPAGSGDVRSIPLARTHSGYNVTAALEDLTVTVSDLDVELVQASFRSLADVLGEGAEEFRDALDGVQKLSRTISARDESLERLFDKAANVSAVLADRNAEITTILTSGNQILAELERRRDVVDELIRQTRAAADQIHGMVEENRARFGPALADLETSLRAFADFRDSLSFTVENLGGFVRSLGESVGSGPYFMANIQNLYLTNMLPILPDLLKAESER